MSYYSSIILISWFALAVLGILVHENARLTKREKRRFYLSYALAGVAALAEWLGVKLSGEASLANSFLGGWFHMEFSTELLPSWVVPAIKCADAVLTPLAISLLAVQLVKRNIWHKILIGVLIFNTFFQIAAAHLGWMLVPDGQGGYLHGDFYWVYLVVYVLVAGLVVLDFIDYGQRFWHHHHASLYGTLLLVVGGTALQELVPGERWTTYISLTMGMALMFIHYNEFSQLEADSHIQEQQIQISTDALTGVGSRFAYAHELEELAREDPLPSDFVAAVIDVDGLKEINDGQGHEAGDELIRGAGACVTSAFGYWGKCYRTGGDEFVVLARMHEASVGHARAQLVREMATWHGELVDSMHVSMGIATAREHPGLSVERLVAIADEAMYEEKARYYQTVGIDRRRR